MKERLSSSHTLRVGEEPAAVVHLLVITGESVTDDRGSGEGAPGPTSHSRYVFGDHGSLGQAERAACND